MPEAEWSESVAAGRMPDEMWEWVKPLLPQPQNTHPFGGERKRGSDREAMDAIFFVLQTGAQWNSLNATGLCSSSRAHRRFQEWQAAGVFEQLGSCGLFVYDKEKRLKCSWQSRDGRRRRPRWRGKKTGPNPTDRAKSGAKRSVLTEADGIPVGLAIGGANVNDIKLMRETLERIPIKRPTPTPRRRQHLCLDQGYDHQEASHLARAFQFTAHIPRRGQQLKPVAQRAHAKARRWVVERTHRWMNRFRRILIRREKKSHHYLAMLHLALAFICFHSADVLAG